MQLSDIPRVISLAFNGVAIPQIIEKVFNNENIKHVRICNEIVEKIKAENKPCKYFYKFYPVILNH
jgi:hypothetical protein